MKKPKLIFIGNPEFGAIILKELNQSQFKPALVICAQDKPVGRKQDFTPPQVKVAAKKCGLKTIQTDDICNLKSRLSKIEPDLIIVAACSQIIPREILDIPKHGCLNIHPSLLPKYRGCSPIQATLLNGDEKTGVSIILMNEEVDAGPILASTNFILGDLKLTYRDLEKELAELGARLLLKTISQWIEKKIKPQPQNELEATYTNIIKREHGFIDWENSAEEIERKIRAFNPWPSAFTRADKKILKIWKAHVLRQTKDGPAGPPGKVYLAPNDRIAIQCGKDYLVVEELQFEGKRKIKVEDFLKGNIDFIGTILK